MKWSVKYIWNLDHDFINTSQTLAAIVQNLRNNRRNIRRALPKRFFKIDFLLILKATIITKNNNRTGSCSHLTFLIFFPSPTILDFGLKKNCNNKKYNFLKQVHSQFKCSKLDLNELGILFINVEVTQKSPWGAVFLYVFLKWKGQFRIFFFFFFNLSDSKVVNISSKDSWMVRLRARILLLFTLSEREGGVCV